MSERASLFLALREADVWTKAQSDALVDVAEAAWLHMNTGPRCSDDRLLLALERLRGE